MHTIEQIRNHPRPPISIDKTQFESLTDKVNFLQEFLEGCNSHVDYSTKADELERRIADAAYVAEDVIESHIVYEIHASRDEEEISPTYHSHDIHAGFTSNSLQKYMDSLKTEVQIRFGSIDLYEGLQKVIVDMDSIKKEAMEIKEKIGVEDDQQHRIPTMPPGSFGFSSDGQNKMVGFEDESLEIMVKLTGGQPDREIIPIVGMGGMGKTTLARNIYAKPLIKEHFDICAWATISQKYDAREILRQIICQKDKDLSENELGETLYKHLWCRRYLVVLDDMWSIEAWDEVRRFLPDNQNGSRIVITTRLSKLAFQLADSYGFEMKFLDEHKSWNLFCKTVFGEGGCPLELEEIGKRIAENCKGLPLSIIVIGGHLAKSNYSIEYWKYIAKNLNSLVNSEDNERCLKILYMSYRQLPVHLKPCFLYMGVFPEDYKIQGNMLIRLWVAEGFLKPVSGKSSEEVAKDCLDELICTNLVRAETRFGKIKYCSIHDLLRDLCLKEAEKERFYINVKGVDSFSGTKGTKSQRLIIIHGRRLEKEVVDKLQSMSLARSLICEHQFDTLPLNFMLLRMVNKLDDASHCNPGCPLEYLFQLVNLRYFDISSWSSIFPCTVIHLWNLHTLIVTSSKIFIAPLEIWKMPQLRHVKFRGGLYLPDPPSFYIDKHDDVVLSNLQSLSTIMGFMYGEGVIKRIPNIRKLRIHCQKAGKSSSSQYYTLDNLDSLHKLESFHYTTEGSSRFDLIATDFLQNIRFPHSLKKLNVDASHVQFDDFMKRIGSLPLLEVLRLQYVSLRGCVWETVEGQFCRLKVLKIEGWRDLEYWNTESTHFPCLEHLVLVHLHELKEIPLNMAEIPTLQSIDLDNCSSSAMYSAYKILEEQEELLGEVTLQVQVISFSEDIAGLKSFASPNFHVISYNDYRRRMDRSTI